MLDGWMDEWMNGWMHAWMDGWVDDGWMKNQNESMIKTDFKHCFMFST